jgi:prepilin-type N-terminal cleavage/methylation domain-containing protein
MTLHKTTSGFTLLELLMVMSLIGVIAAMVAPLIDVDKFRMDAAGLQVSTTLHAAQRKGVLQGHNVNLALDTIQGRIYVHQDANNDRTLQSDESLTIIELDDDVTFGRGGAPARSKGASAASFSADVSGHPALRFYRNGSSNEEGIIYVTSTRSRYSLAFPQDTRAIEIERSTGRVSCFTYKSLSWTSPC